MRASRRGECWKQRRARAGCRSRRRRMAALGDDHATTADLARGRGILLRGRAGKAALNEERVRSLHAPERANGRRRCPVRNAHARMRNATRGMIGKSHPRLLIVRSCFCLAPQGGSGNEPGAHAPDLRAVPANPASRRPAGALASARQGACSAGDAPPAADAAHASGRSSARRVTRMPARRRLTCPCRPGELRRDRAEQICADIT